jgi:hypothetical protein
VSSLGTSLRTTPVQSPATATTVNTVASAATSIIQQAIVTSRPPQSPLLQTRSAITAEIGKPQVTGKDQSCVV